MWDAEWMWQGIDKSLSATLDKDGIFLCIIEKY